MDPTHVDRIRSHAGAVVRLLMGDAPLGHTLGLVIGCRVDARGRGELAGIAAETGLDLVHLDYDDASPRLRHVDLFMRRGRSCHVHTRCRLVLPERAAHAVLAPSGASFHFRVEPGEVIQAPGRAADPTGETRARDKLSDMLARGDYATWTDSSLT